MVCKHKKNQEVINPLKNISCFSWFFEQNVYDMNVVIRALKSVQGSGNIPKVIVKDNIYYSIEDGNENCIGIEYTLNNAIKIANNIKAKEIFKYKINNDNYELLDCVWSI